MNHYPAGCDQDAVDLSCNGDAEPIDELDELTVLDCGHSGTIRNAEQTGGEVICESCYLERKAHPPQLPDFSQQVRDSEMARDLAENGELWDLGKDERMESNASTRND